MLQILIVIGLVVGITTVIMFKLRAKKVKEGSHTYKGLILVKQTQKLIGLVQQHRGISNAIHHGNDKFLVKLKTIQQEIDNILSSQSSVGFSDFGQWESFKEHWPRLKLHSVDSNVDAQNIMSQHGAVIEAMLFMLEDINHEYKLYTIMLDDNLRLAEVCIDTLRTAETIAQARGLGVGICTAGRSVGAQSSTLEFLKNSVSHSANDLFLELTSIQNKNLSSSLNTVATSFKNSSNDLIEVIESDLIKQREVSLNSQEYFQIATKPVNELFDLFDQIMGHISQKYVYHS